MKNALLLLGLAALAAAPQDSPFNGKDLTGWKPKGSPEKNKWKVGKAVWDKEAAAKLSLAEGTDLVNPEGHGVDLYSEAKWGDAVIEVEVLVPKGSNSGVYVMGEYEVQVLDSFGKEKVGAGDMGGLYGASAPKVNASKAPGEWQKFVIDYRAPKFDRDGKKTANLKFVKIELNGQVIHENVELKGPTPGGITGKEAAEGPIMFQGDHGSIAYRAIKVTPIK
ncbi:MAG: DUF1080 domain-containing protein [Planctomycetes bacterium]|nr:DUF1080 domain-containing protein [Planctomycetota bacterium]